MVAWISSEKKNNNEHPSSSGFFQLFQLIQFRASTLYLAIDSMGFKLEKKSASQPSFSF